jgi:hypothetical protein
VYHFPQLHLTELVASDQGPEQPGMYSFSESAAAEVKAEKRRAETARLRAEIEEMNAMAREEAMNCPLSATVRGYRQVNLRDPRRGNDSQLKPLEAVNGIEMAIHGSQLHLVFDAQCSNPEIVFGNRLALLFQVEPKPRVHLRGGKGDVEDVAVGYQPFHFRHVLVGVARVQGTVSQFPNDRNWQQEFCDGLRNEGCGPIGEHVNGDAGVERYAIATHGDRCARIPAR